MMSAILVTVGVVSLAAVAWLTRRLVFPVARRVANLITRLEVEAETATSLLAVLHQSTRGVAELNAKPLPTGSWRQIGGGGNGWDDGQFYKVRSVVSFDGRLYASLIGPNPEGPVGQIWEWDGVDWKMIAGRGHPWPGDALIDQLVGHDGKLYAGAGGRLWTYDGVAWTDVAGELPLNGKSGVYAFASLGKTLYATAWGDPAVLAFNGSHCRRLPGPTEGWGERVRTVYCAAVYNDHLYVGTGTGSYNGLGGMVFRWDGDNWEKVGGTGLRGSWVQGGVPFILSLRPFDGRLIATLSRPVGTPTAISTVWAFDGAVWQPVAPGLTPDLMSRSLIINDSLDFHGSLVVATGDNLHRNSAVWAYDHLKGGWLNVSGRALYGHPDGVPGGQWIYTLASDGLSIYAGTAGYRGAAKVFQFVPDAIQPPSRSS